MGKDPKTTIEINGKHYDTRTGKELSSSVIATKPAAPKPATVKPSMSEVTPRSSTTSKAVHKNTERSQTLMRHAVKKPAGSKLSRSKSMMDVLSPVKPQPKPRPNLHSQNYVERTKRASAVAQSALVTKFSDFTKRPASPASAKAAVHPLELPVTKRVEPLAVQPHPAAPVETPAVNRAPLNHTQSVLAAGLQNANSHLEKPHKKAKKHARGRRIVSFSAGALAVLLLAGFFTLQNAPNLSLRYASARAGVHASMPGYHPSGFAVNNSVEYSPGAVTISFKSNTDSRAYDVTQKNSNWDSDALMNNYVATVGDTPQTVTKGGRTIYLYGDSNATWVNAGVWYNITGASKLNTDQLLDIATSI